MLQNYTVRAQSSVLWLTAIALGLGGCGRLDYDPVSAESRPWQGNFTLTEPELVAELSSSSTENECFLVGDGLTIYFNSNRPGGSGGSDIYKATRADIDSPWQDVTRLEALNTRGWEGGLSITEDGRTAFVSSNRGDGEIDLFSATREDRTRDFPAGGFARMSISTEGQDYDPWPSPDGLRLYFVSAVVPDGLGLQDILISERASVDDEFSPPSVIAEVSSDAADDNPYLDPEELFIVFSSRRPGGAGDLDLWYATRPDRSSPFSTPEPLPVVNTGLTEWEPCFTATGELYFSSDRGEEGALDLYRSRFVEQ